MIIIFRNRRLINFSKEYSKILIKIFFSVLDWKFYTKLEKLKINLMYHEKLNVTIIPI